MFVGIGYIIGILPIPTVRACTCDVRDSEVEVGLLA